MKTQTSELSCHALNWAVATCLGYTDLRRYQREDWDAGLQCFRAQCFLVMTPPRKEWGPVPLADLAFSSDWAQGGPIIERADGFQLKHWIESKRESQFQAEIHNRDGDWIAFGPTPLVAAMRCLAASELGGEVDVPDMILKEEP